MYNIYIKDSDGRRLVHSGASYAETELYRSECSNIEVFDVGADPYEESRTKRAQRGAEAQQEARMIAHRDYGLAMTDFCGQF